MSSPDFDAELLKLENLVRDGISPRMAISFRVVPCSAGKLLIVRIEKSWIRPHRVIFRGHDKFYARTSAGTFALDVGQLRSVFLHSATVSEEISAFRVDRIIDIFNDRGPVALVKAPATVLHLVPIQALTEQPEYDLTRFHQNAALLRPWNSSGWSQRMTFDGAMLHTPLDAEGRVSSDVHFYRNVLSRLLPPRYSRHGRFLSNGLFGMWRLKAMYSNIYPGPCDFVKPSQRLAFLVVPNIRKRFWTARPSPN